MTAATKARNATKALARSRRNTAKGVTRRIRKLHGRNR